MCTLAVFQSVFREAPLVVAANRDERLDRASAGPQIWPQEPLLAPRDLVAGGTWWALHSSGLFVALTNRAQAYFGERRSRGLLVRDVAVTGSVSAAAEFVDRLQPRDFNGFHLVVTDGRRGLLAVNSGESIRVEPIGTGLLVVSERSFGAAPQSRDAHAEERFAALIDQPLDLDAIEAVLRTHEGGPLDSVCVHVPEMNYGTRSGTVLALDGLSGTLRYAKDAPCRAPFQDLTDVLAEFRALA